MKDINFLQGNKMKRNLIVYILTFFSLSYGGWQAGGGRATNSFDSNVKINNGDTLELSWQASEEIDDDYSSVIKNCNYKVIIKSVLDMRENKNLIGTCSNVQPKANIYVKGFSEWIRSAIQSEVTNYCGRSKRNHKTLFVDVRIKKFIVKENDRHYGYAEVQLLFKHENSSKVISKVGTYNYDTWGKTLNPYLYQKVISNIVVKIAGTILSVPVN